MEGIAYIEIFDKKEKALTRLEVQKISDNVYRMLENDILNPELVYGTEFETFINKDGKHEILRITRKSDFITRRFAITPQYKPSEYQLIGDEIKKRGGFWQVDFGSIATVNILKESELEFQKVVEELKLTEIF